MVKRKNNLNRNNSLIVKFYPATDKEIFKLLRELNLTGTKISNLINRWSIDVPFWREKHFTEKLLESELVEKVHENLSFNKKNQQDLDDE